MLATDLILQLNECNIGICMAKKGTIKGIVIDNDEYLVIAKKIQQMTWYRMRLKGNDTQRIHKKGI